MSSQGGLQRRRVNNAASALGNGVGDSSSSRRDSSSLPPSLPSSPRLKDHADKGIAFDPRDLQVEEEQSQHPKLTLMEEVLLLGLKDRQVRSYTCDTLKH